MANRSIIDNGSGSIGSFPPLSITEQGFTEAQVAWLSGVIQSITGAINGGLSFGTADHATRVGNFSAQWISVYFKDANVEIEIPHGLGRKAVEILIGVPDKAASFYTAKRGSWTENTIWLASNTAGVTVNLLVL